MPKYAIYMPANMRPQMVLRTWVNFKITNFKFAGKAPKKTPMSYICLATEAFGFQRNGEIANVLCKMTNFCLKRLRDE